MAISIQCSACRYRARIRDELAGKRVACPQCREPIRVPACTTTHEAIVVSANIKQGGPPQARSRASTGRRIFRRSTLILVTSAAVAAGLCVAVYAFVTRPVALVSERSTPAIQIPAAGASSIAIAEDSSSLDSESLPDSAPVTFSGTKLPEVTENAEPALSVDTESVHSGDSTANPEPGLPVVNESPDAPSYIESAVFEEFRSYRRTMELDKALEAARIALDQTKTEFGERSVQGRQAAMVVLETDELKFYLDRAYEFRERKEYRQALLAAKRVLMLERAYHGPGHAQVTQCLNWIAAIEKDVEEQRQLWHDAELSFARDVEKQEMENAVASCQILLKDKQSALGERHSEIAETLRRLGQVEQAAGLAKNAVKSFEAALQIDIQVLHDRDYQLRQDECLLETARWLAKCDVTTQKHLTATQSWIHKFMFRPMPRRVAAVELPVLLDELAFIEGHSGINTTFYHALLYVLGKSYGEAGNLADSDRFLRKALESSEVFYGRNHPFYIDTLHILLQIGITSKDARIERYASEAIDIAFKLEGGEGERFLRSQEDWIEYCLTSNDFVRALPTARLQVHVSSFVYGERHELTGKAYCNLARVYGRIRELDSAREAAEQALKIFDDAGIAPTGAHLSAISVLALVNEEKGNLQRAIELRLREVQISEQLLGPDNLRYLRSMGNLAAAYFQNGDTKQALDVLDRSMSGLRKTLGNVLDTQSERQQLLLLSNYSGTLFAYLTMAIESGDRDDKAYQSLLDWKGAVFAHQLARSELAESDDAEDLMRRNQETSRRLSSLMSYLIDGGSSKNDGIKRLEILRNEREELNRELAQLQKSSGLGESSVVSIEHLQGQLPSDSVFIDFQEYVHIDPEHFDDAEPKAERRMLAFLIRARGPVQLVQLGSSHEIGLASTAWKSDISRGQGLSPGVSREQLPQSVLRKLLWDPLEPYITDTKLVIISPYAGMTSFPMGALPGRDPERYLIEDYAMTTVPSAFALCHLIETRKPRNTDDSMMLVGDVNFSESTEAERSRGNFAALPGTAEEIDGIAREFLDQFPGSRLIVARDKTPTEQFFRDTANSCRMLHLATHGYFLPESWTAAPTEEQHELRNYLEQFLPDLLSGIALAEANQQSTDPIGIVSRDDGVLTTLEVASMDLRNVDLAVLSACETTLGQAPDLEGMLGLQRAFQVAGVRSTVSSLWKVDDAATQTLMVEFYKNLWERKLSKLESLRQAQLTMLNQYDVSSKKLQARGLTLVSPDKKAETNQRLPPYYWASFVLSGDWR